MCEPLLGNAPSVQPEDITLPTDSAGSSRFGAAAAPNAPVPPEEQERLAVAVLPPKVVTKPAAAG